VIFDIETTGLINEYDEIIEFAAIKVRSGLVIDKIDFLIKPKNEIPLHIRKMTHITQEMVNDAHGFLPSQKKIINLIGNEILIANNGINFDLRFLNKKLEKNNLPLIENCVIDTAQLSRAINKHLLHHRLGVIARDYGIAYDETIAHRADVDTEILFAV
jgi:DNA polymerase-3 subunit alpha (Gram-positive type)